jgi:diacylglycerol O-acyltransferase / wax synthase
VANVTVPVRSDMKGVLERLQLLHQASQNAGELTNAVGAKAMTDYTQFIPSMLTAKVT